MKPLNQPDIMTLHIEFLRCCELQDSTVSINSLKTGKLACTLQAIASAWKLNPPPLPKPDFKQVLAGKPYENWLPSHYAGDLAPVTGKLLALRPRTNYLVQGFTDSCNTFVGGERIDVSYLTFLADFIPSISHSFPGTSSAQDYNAYSAKVREWCDKNPKVPAVISHTLKDSISAKTLDSTVAMSF